MTRVCVVLTVAFLCSVAQLASGQYHPRDCGRAHSGTDGGHPWPWMVMLRRSDLGAFCGGTLISPDTVLTAAHCTKGQEPADLTARLGEYDTTTTTDGQHTDIPVTSIIQHPEYSGHQNDIALLKLGRPVTFSRRIQPACLPTPNSDHTGKEVSVIGWGADEAYGDASSALRKIDLNVTDPADCERVYQTLASFDSSFPGGFQGTKLCAMATDGSSRDACQGDGGGPLLYRDADRYQVIGIVSTGVGCGGRKFPGVYTKVSKYISWINSEW